MADATTSTNTCDTWKTDLMLAAHNFSAQVSLTSPTGTSTTHVTASSITGVGVGMGVSGASNIAANTVVASLISQTAFDLSIATTGAMPNPTLINGDIFKILLINGLAGNSGIAYGQATTNVGTPGTNTPSNSNVGTDEVAASGQYAAGGQILANNTTPALSTHTAWTSWTVNPTWGATTTASTIGAIIYNTGTTLTGTGTATAQPRLGSVNGITANLSGSAVNHAVAVYDFGGRQAVTSGTITLTFPATGATAILRIA